jgi:hypothetical protein
MEARPGQRGGQRPSTQPMAAGRMTPKEKEVKMRDRVASMEDWVET